MSPPTSTVELRENHALIHFNGISERSCFSVLPDFTRFLVRQYGIVTDTDRKGFRVLLWNSETGDARTIEFTPRYTTRHRSYFDYVYSVAISPDGNTMVAGLAGGGGLTWWDLLTVEELSREPSNPELGPIGSLRFSPTGDLLAVGGFNGLAIVSMESGQVLQRLPGRFDHTEQIAFSADGRYVLLGGKLLPLRLVDVYSGLTARALPSSYDIEGVALSPNLCLAIAGSEDGVAHLFDMIQGEEVISWFQDSADQPLAELFILGPGSKYGEAVIDVSKYTSAAFSPDGRFALTASYDAPVRMWDLTSGQEVVRFARFEGQPVFAAFHPSQARVFVAYRDGSVYAWPNPFASTTP